MKLALFLIVSFFVIFVGIPIVLAPSAEIFANETGGFDLFVDAQAPTLNSGPETEFVVGRALSQGDQRGYLRFNLSSLGASSISSCILKIKEDTGTGTVPIDVDVHEVTEDAQVLKMSEGMIWNNQSCGTSNTTLNSSCDSTRLDRQGVSNNDGWYNFTVTTACSNALSATDDLVGFTLVNITGNNANFQYPQFESKENANPLFDPYLSVDYVGNPAIISINGTGGGDNFVYAGGTTENFGGNLEFLVWTGTSTPSRTYLRFNLSSIPSNATITDAILKIKEDNGYASGTLAISTYEVNETTLVNSWVEGNGGTDNNPVGETTWNNQPCGTSISSLNGSCNSTVLSSQSITNNDGWYNFTITQAVINGYNRASKLMLVTLANLTASNIEVDFESRENTNPGASADPYLEITYTTETVYQRNLTLNLALTQNVKKEFTALKPVSNPITLTGVVERIRNVPKQITGGISISNILTRLTSLSRLSTNQLDLSEIPIRINTLARSLTNAISFTTTRTYDFSDSVNNDAFNNTVTAKPPTQLSPAGETELSLQNYTAISSSDNIYFNYSATDLPYTKFVIKVNESINRLQTIKINWEGRTESSGTINLYVRNFSSNSWVQFDSGSGTSDFTLSTSFSSGFSDLINDSKIHIMVQDPEAINDET